LPARAVKSAIHIPAAGVLAVVRAGFVSIHFAVIKDGGIMLMSVAMKLWRIESAMRMGPPESGTIAKCRKTKITVIALKRPFEKTAVSVCFMRNVLWLRDMMKISG
jgi:hypothetical protein